MNPDQTRGQSNSLSPRDVSDLVANNRAKLPEMDHRVLWQLAVSGENERVAKALERFCKILDNGVAFRHGQSSVAGMI